MYKIALVDDEFDSSEKLTKCIEEYSKEFGVMFNVSRFRNGLNFIEEYSSEYDIVFMDIDMPHMNGMDAAERLRAMDPSVILIFVTFLAKYAIRGYKYDALDYMLKPVNYGAFKITMSRAIQRCAGREGREVILPSAEGKIRIELSCLDYVEISNHDITYHTSRGLYRAYGTMRAIEKLLPSDQFSKCNRCYLVNLRSVTRIQGNHVYVGDEELEISRPRKQEFLDALNEYNARR
ncbi:MAG: response regulator transcription factor [Lachnospiraceae bacterium]|nr:response regulator transcription factor [Lachnospiraceae bacterium]